jgi:hypothetical protein
MSQEITDISMKNVTRNCDTDCSYKFNYLEESAVVMRDRGFISSTYKFDKTKEPPVIFNEKKFAPFTSQIIAPSPIMINGSYPPGEIRIQHLLINDKGEVSRDDSLMVIIPFKISDESSTGSQIITDIINKVNDPMTEKGPMGMFTMTYNLQNVVPVKSFFYLKKTDNTRSANVIIYGDSGAIPLSSTTMEELQKLTKPRTPQAEKMIQMELGLPPVKELFFNPNGEDNLFSGLTSLTNQSFSQASSFPSFGSSFLSSGKTTETTKTTQEQSTTQQSNQEKSLLQSMQIQPSSTGKQKLDISIKNVTGNCDLKCSYGFKYSESSSVAKNNGIMISLTYDSAYVPPVTFNG